MPNRVEKTRVTNAILYEDGYIRLDNVRLSYPHLAKPYAGTADSAAEPKYGAVFLLDKKTHVAAKDLLKAEIDRIARENKVTNLGAQNKFLRNGDDQGKNEYVGMFSVSAREANKPRLRDRKGNECGADLFYAGCYVNAIIRPWWQDNKFGKKVNANLVAVQFLRDGEAFGEGRISDDEIDETFDEYGDDDGGFDVGAEDGDL